MKAENKWIDLNQNKMIINICRVNNKIEVNNINVNHYGTYVTRWESGLVYLR